MIHHSRVGYPSPAMLSAPCFVSFICVFTDPREEAMLIGRMRKSKRNFGPSLAATEQLRR
jgi:hypothetical protein